MPEETETKPVTPKGSPKKFTTTVAAAPEVKGALETVGLHPKTIAEQAAGRAAILAKQAK